MPLWLDTLLDGVCHRYPEHGLAYGGQAAPLCARCSGLFGGALLVLVLLAIAGGAGRRGAPPWWAQGAMGALLLWWALDGLNSLAFQALGAPLLYEPSNGLRLYTGLGAGLAVALALWPIAVDTLARSAPEPAVARPHEIAGLSGALVMLAAVLLSARMAWAPVAAWSVLGVVAVLGTANGLLVVLLIDKVRRLDGGWRKLVALSGGLALTILETGTLAFMRGVLGV